MIWWCVAHKQNGDTFGCWYNLEANPGHSPCRMVEALLIVKENGWPSGAIETLARSWWLGDHLASSWDLAQPVLQLTYRLWAERCLDQLQRAFDVAPLERALKAHLDATGSGESV